MKFHKQTNIIGQELSCFGFLLVLKHSETKCGEKA